MQAVTILAGTYERLLYGFDLQQTDDVQKFNLKMSIAYSPHISAITSVAVSGCAHTGSAQGGLLATGSSDEIIRVYDIRRRKEVGSLHSHRGTITALAFHGQSHLFSGGADGVISLYRTKDWELLHTFPSHTQGATLKVNAEQREKIHVGKKKQHQLDAKKQKPKLDEDGKPVKKKSRFHINDNRLNIQEIIPIVDLAIHPSGKLMLSLAEDRTLRLWDLARARPAFTTKLPLPVRGDEGEQAPRHHQNLYMRLGSMLPVSVEWHPDGKVYSVLYEHAVEVFDMSVTAEGAHKRFFLDAPRLERFHAQVFYKDWLMCACEDGLVRCYYLGENDPKVVSETESIQEQQLQWRENEKCWAFKAHEKRLKSLRVVETRTSAFVVTISSTGSIRVWSLENLTSKHTIKMVCEHESGSRLTCLDVYVPRDLAPEMIYIVEEDDLVDADVANETAAVSEKPQKKGRKL